MTIEQHDEPTIYEKYLGVLAQPRTYTNLVYLAMSFPLGLAYFILLVVGFSLGVSLLIIWVGIPILVAMLLLSYGITTFERQMAISMLGVSISAQSQGEPVSGLWDRFKGLLRNPITWKGILYQFIKFPMGIASFVMLVTLILIPLALMAAPFLVGVPDVYLLRIGSASLINNMNTALFAAFIGFVLLVGSLHALNGMAWAHGQLAKVLLGQGE
jgi:hypothetical protein